MKELEHGPSNLMCPGCILQLGAHFSENLITESHHGASCASPLFRASSQRLLQALGLASRLRTRPIFHV